VFLVDVEGYSVGEAAELLNCSRSATKARLARGRKALRRLAGGAR
jgi:DNA-directed RNA polymerase specialized sigma24 family protein